MKNDPDFTPDVEHDQPLEVHIHGDIKIRPDVPSKAIDAALAALLDYPKTHFAAQGKKSLYPDDGGILMVRHEDTLKICWSVAAGTDYRDMLDELVMSLNDIASEGAALEISVYDLAWDMEDEDEEDVKPTRGAKSGANSGVNSGASADEDEDDDSQDDFFVLFVGPTPAAIMKVQRDLLVRDVTMLMERHFERDEMPPVIQAIDGMWDKRYKAMQGSLSTLPSFMQAAQAPVQSTHGAHGGRGVKPTTRHSH